jgi:hypothetical protein
MLSVFVAGVQHRRQSCQRIGLTQVRLAYTGKLNPMCRDVKPIIHRCVSLLSPLAAPAFWARGGGIEALQVVDIQGVVGSEKLRLGSVSSRISATKGHESPQEG